MYKPLFNQRKALRFRKFSRKGYALFACLGRVVTIGVLSVATLRAAASTTTDDVAVVGGSANTVATDDTPDKEATLDGIEVTGSRAPLALGQAARMVTVLSREDIQAAPVQSINDLLKMAVGVDVRQRGPIGAQTDIGIRGGTSEQIAILLNGVNICDPQTAHNAFDLPCDLSDIERIEVLEGPAGRVYGTSSMVGAINIVTRRHAKREAEQKRWQGEARLEGGSFGYLSAAVRGAFCQHSLSVGYTRSDGYSRSKAGSLNSDYSGFKAFYQGGVTLGEKPQPSADKQPPTESQQLSWHVGLSTKGFGSNTFYSAKYDEQYEKTAKLFAALRGHLQAGRLHIQPAIYWNRSHDRFELIRGTEAKVPYNHHRTDVFGINLNSWFDWLLGRTAFGAEFRNEDIVSSNLGEPLNNPFDHYKVGLNRSNLSFHLEHNVLLRRFTLSAGFIAVKNTWNEMPFKIYPGIDASLRIGNQWKVYASYNASLRMPSFTELYYSVGGHQADKRLKPEELQAVEGGVKYNNRWLSAKASVFHHHSRNMIDWVMDTRDAQAVWHSVNHTKVNTLGEELAVSITPADYRQQEARGFGLRKIELAYCHLHQSKNEEPFLQSRYSLEYLRNKMTAMMQLHLVSRLDLTLHYRWHDRTGTYTDTGGTVRSYRPYSVVDSRLSWNADNYSFYIEANNLTAHRYVDYGNVPQPGFWLTVGARYRL